MKTVHYTTMYFDNWGYQENLMPHYFNLIGQDVCVVSPDRLPAFFKVEVPPAGRYKTDGLDIIRHKVSPYFSYNLYFPRKLYRILKAEKPDLIFHHAIGATSLLICALYKLLHPKCILMVDNHADKINCVTSKIWFLFYYKIILTIMTNLVSPLVTRYYGVTYGRCDFMEEVFRISKKKIEMLPIGADTMAADRISLSKQEIRSKYALPPDKYIVVSGGKLGLDKGTDHLIRAVDMLRHEGRNIMLVLFGSINDKTTADLVAESAAVKTFGWCDREQTLELLKMADLASWTVHHTTLIEDSIACLTPLVIRKTRTTEHLIEGNGLFIEENNAQEIAAAVRSVFESGQELVLEKCLAMREKLDYRNIVSKICTDAAIQKS